MFTKRVDKCCNGGNQHKFKPRYTEKSTGLILAEVYGLAGTDNLRKLMILDIYINDVCEWCGKTINKQENV